MSPRIINLYCCPELNSTYPFGDCGAFATAEEYAIAAEKLANWWINNPGLQFSEYPQTTAEFREELIGRMVLRPFVRDANGRFVRHTPALFVSRFDDRPPIWTAELNNYRETEGRFFKTTGGSWFCDVYLDDMAEMLNRTPRQLAQEGAACLEAFEIQRAIADSSSKPRTPKPAPKRSAARL